MRKIILLELVLLIMGTTFQGDNQQGWYIQPIPVNKSVVDIYFIDTLNGWAVTDWAPAYDTGYILKTTNGGINWIVNYSLHSSLYSVQFLDMNTGYICGGFGFPVLYKTTNSGNNWSLILNNGHLYTDLHFINKDTGWVCDPDLLAGFGLLKTTNGGVNWAQQLDNSYQPQKLFFLNKDTGWVMTANNKLYRTNNSGDNWIPIYNFGASTQIFGLFFTSSDTGWITQTGLNNDAIVKTTNGGMNWISQPHPAGDVGTVFMINSNYGYIGHGLGKILKTFDGINWNYQIAPDGSNDRFYFTDSLHGWAKHMYTSYDISATVDGGGPITQITNNNQQIVSFYQLFQNYPNPFNSMTNVKFQMINKGLVEINVYNIAGKLIKVLINQNLNSGKYNVQFDASGQIGLTSGVYFYTLFVDGNRIDTKKMILIK